MSDLDLLPTYPWDALLARLRQISNLVPSGAAKVTLSLLVRDGRPVIWSEPKVVHIEPKAAMRQFLDGLDTQDGGKVNDE